MPKPSPRRRVRGSPKPPPPTAPREALEQLLTATDAARVLVMSPENVRRLTRIGVLKARAVTVSPLRPILLYRLTDVEALAVKRARPYRQPTPSELAVFTEDPMAAARGRLEGRITEDGLIIDRAEPRPTPVRTPTPRTPRRRR